MAPAWHFDISSDKRQLFLNYPPRKSEACKQVFFDLAEATMQNIAGDIRIIRTKAASRSVGDHQHRANMQTREGFYDYENSQQEPGNETVDWHVNFADHHLFGFYHTALFAQDEIMVAEHPILASIREYLLLLGESKGDEFLPQTQDEDGLPTPFLILGVDRCLNIDTAHRVADGVVEDLYGSKLADAPISVLKNATTKLADPVPTNIVAMKAPDPGHGRYKAVEIESAFLTALTAFSAISDVVGDVDTRIHTGNWGCGAFGGNKTLMYIIQLVAANWTGISNLVFYDCDSLAMSKAKSFRELIWDYNFEFADLIKYLVDREFEWGVSDGN
jgi:hypothetical protein